MHVVLGIRDHSSRSCAEFVHALSIVLCTGLLLAAALSSHTWEHHPQDKKATIFINDNQVGDLDLYSYELNHNNIHIDLGGLAPGIHDVRVELANAGGGAVLSQVRVPCAILVEC